MCLPIVGEVILLSDVPISLGIHHHVVILYTFRENPIHLPHTQLWSTPKGDLQRLLQNSPRYFPEVVIRFRRNPFFVWIGYIERLATFPRWSFW